MTKLFISYRRDDSADIAGRIYDRLAAKFGKEAVFKDVDSIPLGANFKKYLEDAVQQCAVELVIIGKQWLDITDEHGQRRLDNPRDFVRIEIEAALSRDIPVIPLLVGGASMPPEDRLPPSMVELTYRNGTEVRRDPDFHRDMDRVIASVERWLAAKPAPATPTPATKKVKLPEKPAVVKPSFTLPMLEWCDIPAGKVMIWGKVYTVEAFRMAKYPVTNEQFQLFKDAGDGYRAPAWWDFSEAARAWRKQNQAPAESSFMGDKLPRENVCWYEAVAFCHWLSAKTDLSISLPTEMQWQRAAQGDDGREYPWGGLFDKAKCNTLESGINQTTPVDRYPQGASPYRVLDMSGNVFEWCLNEHGNLDNASVDGINSRVLRGGSWLTRSAVGAASRDHGDPGYRSGIIGFRVVCGTASF